MIRIHSQTQFILEGFETPFERTMRVRAAVAGYMLLRWSVDASPDHSLKEEHYRLWLSDPLALYGVENAKLAPGYRPPVSALKK
jgi:hypothetical protein